MVPRSLLRSFLLTLPCVLVASNAHALDIRIQAGSIEYPDLPAPVQNLKLECRTGDRDTPIQCKNGSALMRLADQTFRADFELSQGRDGMTRVSGHSQVDALSYSDATGRYASENLKGELQFALQLHEGSTLAEGQLKLSGGQAYVEPVFVDFSAAPASLRASATLQGKDVHIQLQELRQRGVLQASGHMHLADGKLRDSVIDLETGDLSTINETYLQPFVLGTNWEGMTTQGSAQAKVSLRDNSAHAVQLRIADGSVRILRSDIEVTGLDGQLNWAASQSTEPSFLRWEKAQAAKLPLAGATARFLLHPRGLSLQQALRIGVSGGAIKFHRLSLRDAGRPDMSAELDLEIEPIDLAELCRTLGWPEFGGQLSGRLPGLRLEQNELLLDGALKANAFDGSISVDSLRVLDPFGRVPRVASNIRLRNLDLAALTGAFSFGRIEGRLDGDVEGLRLRRFRPIAFRARIATPEDDRSRHRISQRAIDNISSIGGGPTGLLSRGVLRFFDDFAYERIGWSCELRDGICHMDGLEPARGGGYVLVKGRWLPRIDVVGFNHRVDWNTFVQQVRQAIETGGDVDVR